jgi:hypothetical protein
VSIITIQRRYRELGRIRAGEKGPKGEPRKLSKWRITTPSRALADEVAVEFGGEVKEWADAPGGSQWEIYTDAKEINVYVPPQDMDRAQYFEEWSAAGVKRRCDGMTELISGRECMCNPEARKCQLTTHLTVILPQIPDLGVWRITTHGWNAAAELPATVELLRRIHEEGDIPAAVLGLSERSEIKDGKTRRYVVPELRLPYKLTEHSAAGLRTLGHGKHERPRLPGDRPALPEDASFNGENPPGWGTSPALPGDKADAAATREQVVKMHALAHEFGWDEDEKHRRAGVTSLNDLSMQAASELIELWENSLAREAGGGDVGNGEGSGESASTAAAPATTAPSPPDDDNEPATPEQWLRTQQLKMRPSTVLKKVQAMPGGEKVTTQSAVTKAQMAAVIHERLGASS